MKQKRYWLRGGIISTILLFLPLIYLQNNFDWEILKESVSFQVYILLNKLPLLFSPSNQVSKIIIALILYFILGAIIGWIYGKFKNRKKDNTV